MAVQRDRTSVGAAGSRSRSRRAAQAVAGSRTPPHRPRARLDGSLVPAAAPVGEAPSRHTLRVEPALLHAVVRPEEPDAGAAARRQAGTAVLGSRPAEVHRV